MNEKKNLTRTYLYDDQNRVISVAVDDAPPVVYAYDPAGNRLSSGSGIPAREMPAPAAPPVPPPSPAPASPALSCPSCGIKVAEGSRFCPSCGARLGEKKPAFCASCGASLKPGARFCPKCGKQVG